jgi:hypothetical protein
LPYRNNLTLSLMREIGPGVLCADLNFGNGVMNDPNGDRSQIVEKDHQQTGESYDALPSKAAALHIYP